MKQPQHSQERKIYAPAGFEPAIPAKEQPQAYALGRPAVFRLTMLIIPATVFSNTVNPMYITFRLLVCQNKKHNQLQISCPEKHRHSRHKTAPVRPKTYNSIM